MRTALAAASCLVLLASCQPADESDGFVPLFNANDLQGWVNANCAPETWSIKNGIISCTGKPIGALRTERQYENFIIEIEWRHLSEGGNSGVFVWGGPLNAPGVPFLRGIEVQVLDHGYTELMRSQGQATDWFGTNGDVFPVGVRMTPFPPLSPDGSRSFPREHRAKGHGEWNHYYVRAIDGEVRLWVNGGEVSGGTGCDPAEGYLCLESEGSPIRFRRLRIRELPGPESTER